MSASGERLRLQVFFNFFISGTSCCNCPVHHRVRGNLTVILAVLHDEVGDNRNGRIRYFLTFFFPCFLASSEVFSCAPCLYPLLTTGNATMQ